MHADRYLVRMAFSARFVRDLIAFVAQRGFSPEGLYLVPGLDRTELEDEHARVDAGTVGRMWSKAIEVTGDQDIGIHLGEFFFFHANRPVHVLMQSSADVLQAFENGVRYSGLVATVLENRLQVQEHSFRIVFDPRPHWLAAPFEAIKCTLDVTMVCVLRSLQMLTNDKHFPLRAQFGFKAPASVNEYYRVFNCPISFAPGESFIEFDRGHLERVVQGRDQALLKYVRDYADQRISAIDEQRQGFVLKVKRAIYAMADPRFPTLDRMAHHLAMSPRTFQRALSADGFVYKDLLEEVRMECCQRYLERDGASVSDLGYLLGYSDPSAFIKAFKRWYGIAPLKYMKQRKASVG
jgi:AraC-like DNA-binding protein